jgi:hypothetical protein
MTLVPLNSNCILFLRDFLLSLEVIRIVFDKK